MVKTCSAYGCGNRASKDSPVSIHSIPLHNRDLCPTWIAALRHVDSKPTSNSSVCSDHFLPSDGADSASERRKLKQDVTPSIVTFPNFIRSKSTEKEVTHKTDENEVGGC